MLKPSCSVLSKPVPVAALLKPALVLPVCFKPTWLPTMT
jgi:hypothetical protein